MQERKQYDGQSVPIQKHLTKFKLLKPKQQMPIYMSFIRLFKLSDPLFLILEKIKNDSPLFCPDFYFKILRKVQFNQKDVVLHFKRFQQKLRKIEDYTQQLKSLNDQFFHKLAMFIQIVQVQGQENHTKAFKRIDFNDNSHRQILPKILQKLENKLFILIFMQVSKDELVFDKLIISRQLLKKTGYEEQQIKLQYLKYGNVFIQILGKQFYEKFIRQFGHIMKLHIKKKHQQAQKNSIFQNKNKLMQMEKIEYKQFFIQFDDFIFKKKKNPLFQQKLKSKISFYKPHQKMSVFEFDIIDQQNITQQLLIDQIYEIKSKIQNETLQTQNNQLNSLIVEEFSEHAFKKNDCQYFQKLA